MASVAQRAPRVPEWRSIDPAAVGRRIREARVAAGLSQRQLSFPGCSAAYISRLEAGDRTPSGHLLEELAGRVGTTSHYLATGQDMTVLLLPTELVRKAALQVTSPTPEDVEGDVTEGEPVVTPWDELLDVLRARLLDVAAPEHLHGLS